MVVKTDKCAFSEFNIFPGHGMKFVKRDGTPLMVRLPPPRAPLRTPPDPGTRGPRADAYPRVFPSRRSLAASPSR